MKAEPAAKQRTADFIRQRAAELVIDDTVTMTFADLSDARVKRARLRIPALLLLSRADELQARLPKADRDVFDGDASRQLLLRDRGQLENLKERFDSFSVRRFTSAPPAWMLRGLTVILSGMPSRSASLNLTPARSSLSS